jgi:hypothetical protein
MSTLVLAALQKRHGKASRSEERLAVTSPGELAAAKLLDSVLDDKLLANASFDRGGGRDDVADSLLLTFHDGSKWKARLNDDGSWTIYWGNTAETGFLSFRYEGEWKPFLDADHAAREAMSKAGRYLMSEYEADWDLFG